MNLRQQGQQGQRGFTSIMIELLMRSVTMLFGFLCHSFVLVFQFKLPDITEDTCYCKTSPLCCFDKFEMPLLCSLCLERVNERNEASEDRSSVSANAGALRPLWKAAANAKEAQRRRVRDTSYMLLCVCKYSAFDKGLHHQHSALGNHARRDHKHNKSEVRSHHFK
ncbi:hypothetical protein JOB18_032016 [Solea senegalensis]|uniref:Uncharacterized protein n=1 Tax=Solea senegalensis TaxID=28829 RepID=A0AAV6RPK1_SOLSE|nr:hypothetical protein JOB18_032016 [Solea senegalensis]